jgi:hypothetical protein
MDETWSYHCEPGQSNSQWSGGTTAEPTQKIPSAKVRWKISGLDFLDQKCLLLIDYLPKGQTINTEYYSSLPVQLKDIKKNPE